MKNANLSNLSLKVSAKLQLKSLSVTKSLLITDSTENTATKQAKMFSSRIFEFSKIKIFRKFLLSTTLYTASASSYRTVYQ